jgi:hypothetical protein
MMGQSSCSHAWSLITHLLDWQDCTLSLTFWLKKKDCTLFKANFTFEQNFNIMVIKIWPHIHTEKLLSISLDLEHQESLWNISRLIHWCFIMIWTNIVYGF